MTELHCKGGCLCRPAREGALRCPLMIRPTSEDVITGQLAQALRILNPRHWVSDLLNVALGSNRFGRQIYRRFRIDLWVNKPCYPRAWLPWEEGSTQVDLEMSWENPPTTVYVEAKYGSGLAQQTSGDDGRSGYPSDQLVRNIRVGFRECGYFREDSLFEVIPRDFIMIVLGPRRGEPLVSRYRDPARLLAGIPHADRLAPLPCLPFIGELPYGAVREVLRGRYRFYTRAERVMIDLLDEYLAFKQATCPR